MTVVCRTRTPYGFISAKKNSNGSRAGTSIGSSHTHHAQTREIYEYNITRSTVPCHATLFCLLLTNGIILKFAYTRERALEIENKRASRL